MKSELDPITDDEQLFRRVHRMRFRTQKDPLISPSAFEPRVSGNEPDVDGISLFRADCVGDPNAVLELIDDPVKRAANGIVSVSVGELRDLGLSVVSTPREDIVGHVSIPEMSSDAMRDAEGRKRCKKWMLQLATLASRDENIVSTPGSE